MLMLQVQDGLFMLLCMSISISWSSNFFPVVLNGDLSPRLVLSGSVCTLKTEFAESGICFEIWLHSGPRMADRCFVGSMLLHCHQYLPALILYLLLVACSWFSKLYIKFSSYDCFLPNLTEFIITPLHSNSGTACLCILS